MKKIFSFFLFLYATMPMNAEIVNEQDTIKTYNMDEVVVTSSSKETNDLRTLPAAITIVSPQQINNRQVASLKDISSFVPNLYMPDYGAKLTSAIYIRGIGARSSGQSVGLYVDNAPYLDKSTFDFELTDIRHIEVLRGPQGTLYGRNAMGGIVNIHTVSPLNYQSTKIALSYGNYNRFDAKISHYTKFGDNLGLSVGAYYDRNDGFFTNAYDGKKIDNYQSVGGNIKLHWQVSPTFKVAYSISAEYTDQGAFPYGLYDESTGKIAQVNINDESSYNRKMINNNLTLTYETPLLMLTSTIGYQYLDDDMKMDQDYSAASIFTLNQLQKQHALSEEISVKSRSASDYQWSFGTYGFYNKLKTDGPVTFKTDGVKSVLQPVFDNLKTAYPKMPTLTITDENLYIPGNFKTPSYGIALYHQSTYNNLFTKGLSITAGIRLDYEKQDLDYTSESKMHLSMTMPPYQPNPKDISDMYPTSIMDEHISQDFWQVLPKISLKYEFSPRTISYISIAKGYKTGGYNVQMSADIMQNQMQYDVMNAFKEMIKGMEISEPQPIKDVISYKPEQSWNYELGTKSELIKDILRAELTLFYMDVRDLQITKFVNSGNGRILSNAGKAESYGAELSLQTTISSTLSADLNYGYTHATFKNYDNGRTDYKGKRIPYTPQHTLSIGFHYSKLIQNSCINQVFASAQCNGVGDIFWTEENAISQKFYATLNAQIGIRKGIAAFCIWGRNLTDTQYSAFYFESFGKPYVQKGKPLQIGAKISFDF